MNLYTVLMDYQGGTYISQAICRNIDHLLFTLSSKIAWQALGVDLPEPAKREFLEDVAGETPVRVEGMHNVWCVSALLGESVAILHIVKTVMNN